VELFLQSTINVTDLITIIPGIKINHYTNKIELVPISEDSEYKIWRPIEENNQTNFEISIKFELKIF